MLEKAAEMAEKLAAALGVKPEIVGITGQNRIPYLTEGKVDLLLSIGFSDERAQVVDFTDPYAPYYIAVMGPEEVAVKSAADLRQDDCGQSRHPRRHRGHEGGSGGCRYPALQRL